jgi:hypothetical protein
MDWIRAHLAMIGIAAFVAAMCTGFAAIAGSAASGLPFPFLIMFVTVLVIGVLLDRAATNAATGRH